MSKILIGEVARINLIKYNKRFIGPAMSKEEVVRKTTELNLEVKDWSVYNNLENTSKDIVSEYRLKSIEGTYRDTLTKEIKIGELSVDDIKATLFTKPIKYFYLDYRNEVRISDISYIPEDMLYIEESTAPYKERKLYHSIRLEAVYSNNSTAYVSIPYIEESQLDDEYQQDAGGFFVTGNVDDIINQQMQYMVETDLQTITRKVTNVLNSDVDIKVTEADRKEYGTDSDAKIKLIKLIKEVGGNVASI